LVRLFFLSTGLKGKHMDKKETFDNLIKSAVLYRTQGLYREAREAYQSASDLINSGDRTENRDAVLSDLSEKIKELGAAEDHIESAPSNHELPDNVQNLIKNLFSFSEKSDPDTKALAEAVTLAKFGQLERAIEELSGLLDKRSVGTVAAKNILRCHILLSAHDRALSAYKQWESEKKFSAKGLAGIRRLLENLLSKKGIRIPIPTISVDEKKERQPLDIPGQKPEEMLDIGSVLINFDQGPLKGKPVEFDVNFQTGNTVSLLIESKEKNLFDTLSIGFRLREVQYRSSVAIFRGAGVVSAKIMIHEGPKQGDYHVDIKVQDS
jgi:tetratricopeptide (TPR) repeat protein